MSLGRRETLLLGAGVSLAVSLIVGLITYSMSSRVTYARKQAEEATRRADAAEQVARHAHDAIIAFGATTTPRPVTLIPPLVIIRPDPTTPAPPTAPPVLPIPDPAAAIPPAPTPQPIPEPRPLICALLPITCASTAAVALPLIPATRRMVT